MNGYTNSLQNDVSSSLLKNAMYSLCLVVFSIMQIYLSIPFLKDSIIINNIPVFVLFSIITLSSILMIVLAVVILVKRTFHRSYRIVLFILAMPSTLLGLYYFSAMIIMWGMWPMANFPILLAYVLIYLVSGIILLYSSVRIQRKGRLFF